MRSTPKIGYLDPFGLEWKWHICHICAAIASSQSSGSTEIFERFPMARVASKQLPKSDPIFWDQNIQDPMVSHHVITLNIIELYQKWYEYDLPDC